MKEIYERIDGKMSRFSILYRRFGMMQGRKSPVFDPSRGQGRVIAVLNMQSEVSTKDLAYILGIRTASLNELLSKLEKSGYVERHPSPHDGRTKLVALTEKGKALNDIQREGSIYECLSDEDLPVFERCLDKLNSALAKQVVGKEEMINMQEWFADARSRMDDESFRKMAEARSKMFGDSMPDFSDPEVFEKMAQERSRMFTGSVPGDGRSGFGFGFGGFGPRSTSGDDE